MRSTQTRQNRTILALGENSIQRISESHACIIGGDPIGSEIAKSLLLFGMKTITIVDDQYVCQSDIENNFFIFPNDQSKRRIESLKCHLHKINPEATINGIESLSDIFKQEFYNDFSIVILTLQLSFDEINLLNRICRSKNIPFVLADSFSYAGLLFIDFGNDFTIENVSNKIHVEKIANITHDEHGYISFMTEEPPYVGSKSLITFKGLESMKELNGKTIELTCQDDIFSIGDTSSFSSYDSLHPTGYATITSKPFTIHFKPYSEVIVPEAPFSSTFFKTDKHKIIKEFFVSRQKMEKRDQLYEPAVCTTMASIATNEIIKYLTKVLIPLQKQVFVYWKENLFPDLDNPNLVPSIDFKGKNIAVIGVGALGCDVAKILVLKGCKEMTLVDPDSIEITNLNRQFLFSDKDVGKNKAETAAISIHERNPEINIHHYPLFLNEETYHVFTTEWFSKFSLVFALVDSYAGREYICDMCGIAGVPMLTGGISKTLSKWGIYYPKFTPKFKVNQTQKKKSLTPSCTLKLFPYKSEHCIEWAHIHLNQLVHYSLTHELTLDQALNHSIAFFENNFDFRIRDLQFLHPKDQIVDGARFWSKHRVYPNYFEYNPEHFQIILSTIKVMLPTSDLSPISQDHVSTLINDFKKKWQPPNLDLNGLMDESEQNPHVIIPNRFDKCNDDHIEFLTLIANARAKCYNIPPVDSFTVQEFAGNIDSSISTTSSICGAGLIIEALNSLINPSKCEGGLQYVSPLTMLFEHLPKPEVKPLAFTNETFSEWDYWKFSGDNTFEQVQQEIEKRTSEKIINWTTLNGTFLPLVGKASKLKKTFEPTMTFKECFPNTSFLKISVLLKKKNDNRALIPPVVVIF